MTNISTEPGETTGSAAGNEATHAAVSEGSHGP